LKSAGPKRQGPVAVVVVHTANHAARKSKMSCTVTPPAWLKSAGQQVAGFGAPPH